MDALWSLGCLVGQGSAIVAGFLWAADQTSMQRCGAVEMLRGAPLELAMQLAGSNGAMTLTGLLVVAFVVAVVVAPVVTAMALASRSTGAS